MNAKKNKTPELLPLTSDVKKLREYLLKEFEVILSSESKSGQLIFQEWNWLQRITVVWIITFNARRGGESKNSR